MRMNNNSKNLQPNTSKSQSTKLFIGSLNSKPNRSALEHHFSKYGEITKFQLIRDKRRKYQCAGFGFLTFKHEADALKCLKSTHFHQGRELILKRALKGGELTSFRKELTNRRYFVGNLPKGTSNNDLELYFSQFGEIECAYLIRDHRSQKSKNFGYVIFKYENIKETGILLREHSIKGKKIIFDVFKGKNAPNPNKKSSKKTTSRGKVKPSKQTNILNKCKKNIPKEPTALESTVMLCQRIRKRHLKSNLFFNNGQNYLQNSNSNNQFTKLYPSYKQGFHCKSFN